LVNFKPVCNALINLIMKHGISLLLVLSVCALTTVYGQQTTNKPEREQWFMDMGFGMFIHWSMDSQVGAVISHSMAGASEDYL
jgi:alpha-L-fucosidase